MILQLLAALLCWIHELLHVLDKYDIIFWYSATNYLTDLVPIILSYKSRGVLKASLIKHLSIILSDVGDIRMQFLHEHILFSAYDQNLCLCWVGLQSELQTLYEVQIL